MGRAVIRSGTLRTDPNVQLELAGLSKIHYGCAEKLFANWINVDFRPFRKVGFTSYKINLVDRHPFPDSSFSFGYSQDFIEHLQQSDQICFLTELFRTFRMDATIRLSFPGLEGVLKECYTDSSVVTAFKAKQEAFEQLGHLHFLSREELTLNLQAFRISKNKVRELWRIRVCRIMRSRWSHRSNWLQYLCWNHKMKHARRWE